MTSFAIFSNIDFRSTALKTAQHQNERFRVRAAQGEQLTLHVFGVEAADGTRGAGAYTLAIDVLPQVVSVESQTLLPGAVANPGGPTASIVVTLQGDRLDSRSAEVADHYALTYFGADGAPDTADDQVIPVNRAVYNPGRNVDVSSGITFPTAVQQTINLLFDDPLPPGSYRIEVSENVQTAPFNDQELSLLANREEFGEHPVVQQTGGQIVPGSTIEAIDLVLAEGALGDFGDFLDGTPFLTQLHDDLGAILDAALTERGDDPNITRELIDQTFARFIPALGATGVRPASMWIIILDPVGIDMSDDQDNEVNYDLEDGTLNNDFDNVFVDVGGNIEIIVIPNPLGVYTLNVSLLPELPRGAAIFVGEDENDDIAMELTDAMRRGTTQFELSTP